MDYRMNHVLLITCLCSVSLWGQGNSNWTTPLQQVSLPPAITSSQSGIRGLGMPGDGYAYIGSGAGLYQAPITCIAANPANTSCWTALNTGVPLTAGGTTDPYTSARDFDFVNGATYAVFDNAIAATEAHVCRLNGTSWKCETNTP